MYFNYRRLDDELQPHFHLNNLSSTLYRRSLLTPLTAVGTEAAASCVYCVVDRHTEKSQERLFHIKSSNAAAPSGFYGSVGVICAS